MRPTLAIWARGNADFYSPTLDVDSSGNAIAVWSQSVGARLRIWANRYVAPDVTPPPLTLTSPPDGTTTNGPTITVSGSTEPGAQVTVNGIVAAVDSNGTFSLSLALRSGENVIVAKATDSSGNVATASFVVTYLDPAVGLRKQLDLLNDRLAAVTVQAIGVALAFSVALAVAMVLLYRRVGQKTRVNTVSHEKAKGGSLLAHEAR